MLKEFDEILKEATKEVEDILAAEDKGWINLSQLSSEVISGQKRIETVKEARYYALTDPLGTRAIRLMTDYSFGTGINWSMEDERASDVLSNFWDASINQPLLSAKGQRKSSDKLLIDGEIFLALFLGQESTIRRINPLEITEFVTDPDDIENIRYFKREWTDTQGKPHTDYYCSFSNLKDKGCPDAMGKTIRKTQDAFVYHIAINDLGQRGHSYLAPALDWIKLYRKFLASRVAIMLALAKFAWKMKIKGGSVESTKGIYHEEEIMPGSMHIENMAADLQPIKTDSGAAQAYQDGRQLKLQVAAATGWPEQYYGDISIGNLATAKTVELPVKHMCESYQSIWTGAYQDIFSLILNDNGVKETYVDIDFPKVSEDAISAVSHAIHQMCQVFPEFATSQDVQQMALMALGITNVNKVLENLTQEAKRDPNVQLAKALKHLREHVKE